ncbi:MAG TPA: PAS domain S-box protein [Candidatus Obscuribacterales bacterium]
MVSISYLDESVHRPALRDRLLALEQDIAEHGSGTAAVRWRAELAAIAAELDRSDSPRVQGVEDESDRPSLAHLLHAYQVLNLHLENSPLAFIEWDAQSKIRRWSTQAEVILGWKAEEVMGKSLQDLNFIHDDDVTDVQQVEERLLRGEQRIIHCNRNYHKNGSVVYCEWYNSSLTDEQGQVISVLSVVQDITERQAAKLALETSEKRYRQLFDSANDAIFVHPLGAEGQLSNFSDVNTVACQLLGYSREQLMQRSPKDISLPEMNDQLPEIAQRLQQDHQALFDMVLLSQTGEPIPTEINSHLFELEGKLTVLSVVRDSRDRKQAELEIQACIQQEQSLNRVVKTIRNSLDIQTIFSTATREIVDLLGISRALIVQYCPEQEYWQHVAEHRCHESLQDTLNTTIPDRDNPFAERIKRGDIICIDQTSTIEDPINQALADQFPGAWLIVPLRVNGETWGALTLMKEASHAGWQASELELAHRVTDQLAIAIQQAQLYQQAQEQLGERQRAEAALRESLAEKEVLLSEVHHRVKNNLQIISSLLNLQANRTHDPTAQDALRQSQNRVSSIALIHEHLYQSHDLCNINVAQYVRCLTADLYRTYATSLHPVTLEQVIDPQIHIDVDRAISLGLILNELISNALKHGFKAGQAGTLTMSLQAVSPDEYALSIGHDGHALPSDFDPQSSQSMGLKLVSILIQQLKGRLECDRSPQTVFTVYFPSKS